MTTRKPAISRPHPADSIPQRPPAAAPVRAVERFTEQHNVRIRPSVKERLTRAVDKLRYETGDRSISIASLTDQALDAWLTGQGF
jgi:hypothetical protein